MKLLAQALALMLLPLLFTLPACGASAVDNAQRTVTASSRAVLAVEEATEVPFYRTVAEESEAVHDQIDRDRIDEEQAVASFDRRVAPWMHLSTALRASRRVLFRAQEAIDRWREGDSDARWLQVAPCITGSLSTISEALHEVGLHSPEVLSAALALADRYGGTCEVDDTPLVDRPNEPDNTDNAVEGSTG